MMTTSLWAPLEIAINQYLRLDPDCLPQLRKLDGKVIAVEFKGLPVNVTLRIADDRIYVLGVFFKVTLKLVGISILAANLKNFLIISILTGRSIYQNC